MTKDGDIKFDDGVMVMHHATDEIEILRKDVDFAHSKLREHGFMINNLIIKDSTHFQRIDKIEQEMNENFKILHEMKNGIDRAISIVDKSNVSLLEHMKEETINTEAIHKRFIKIVTLFATISILLISINAVLNKSSVADILISLLSSPATN